MTIATVLLVLLALAVVFWQESLLRKREETIRVLREEMHELHKELIRNGAHPIPRNETRKK